MSGSVLIVHDDSSVRQHLADVLGAEGLCVLSASTGREALAVLEEDVPTLLVIGTGLPLLSGWKLVEALAHYPDLAGIPRVLAQVDESAEALAARALATLVVAAPAEGGEDAAAAATNRRPPVIANA